MRSEIAKLALELGVRVNNEECPQSEEYYTGELSDYRFWIYDTGDADFGSDWYWKICERYDYDNEEAQIEGFINSLRTAIKDKEFLKQHPKPRKPALLNRFFDWLTFWGKPNR
jgi:hypothetical protein